MAKGENIKVDLKLLRNIGIIAHIDAGKTTTTESLLFYTGTTHKKGDINDGNTTTDWMVQERERGITITSAAITCFWDLNNVKYRINIIDTPGHVDFTAEVERSLRVLDGAVVIFDGKMGVEPQSETVWRQADKYHVPRFCFINKLNLIGGDFYMSLASIKERLSSSAVAVHLPIGKEYELKGVVDLLSQKAYTYKTFEDQELVEEEIPENMKDLVTEHRSELVEKIVEFDDALMEKYLNGEMPTVDELKQALRKGVVAGKVFPVSGGDSRSPVARKILDTVVEYLPSPLDIPPAEGELPQTGEKIKVNPTDEEPFTGLVFKIMNDPHVGNLAFFRVYSGVLNKGTYVVNSTKGTKERVGRLLLMHANHREEIEFVRTGDIAAVVGLKDSTTGDTLCDEKRKILLENIVFPDPVVSMAIEPKTKADREKMGMALGNLIKEDPTLKVSTNQETGETIISGMGELHLEIIIDRMVREFGVETNTGSPQVAYKETVREAAEREGKFIKQSGGKGQYGHCVLVVEPQEPGKGFEFVNGIKGGAIPKEYIPSIQKGVVEAMQSGVVAGYPVVDIKVTLKDGSFHEVDSSDIAFQIAGKMAFTDAMKSAKPCLLEPYMNIEIIVPEKYVGDINGFVSSKRGSIEGTEMKNNLSVIKGRAPLAELFGLAKEVRAITSGRGSPTIFFSHYDRVPMSVEEKIKGTTNVS
ncbi:elongation factor G [Candidatus Dojkabacteria bacterium]|nr:elongation factor G [Candidatus Dojkabacteria bacterium]